MRDLAALNDCKEAVTAMNTSYSKAFQLKAKISEAFTSFDGSYDLDKLAELHQTEVTAPKTLSCAADTSATISKANAAKAGRAAHIITASIKTTAATADIFLFMFLLHSISFC